MESLKEAHKNHSCATNMIKIERFRKNFNCIALTNDNMDKIPIILSSNLSKEVKSGKYQSLDESICPTDMYSQQDKIKGESPPKTCNFEDLPSKIYIQGKPNPNGILIPGIVTKFKSGIPLFIMFNISKTPEENNFFKDQDKLLDNCLMEKAISITDRAYNSIKHLEELKKGILS